MSGAVGELLLPDLLGKHAAPSPVRVATDEIQNAHRDRTLISRGTGLPLSALDFQFSEPTPFG